MKDAYYFPHDSNARADDKSLYIMRRHGVEGYGLYWLFIETMHESTDGKLSKNMIPEYAYSWHLEDNAVMDFYNTAITCGLFVENGEFFWSERVLRNKQLREEKKQKRSEAGKAGMQSRWGSDNTVITPDNKGITKHNKGKERKGKESKGKETKVKDTTTPPNVDESDDSPTSSSSQPVPAKEIFEAWNKVWDVTPIPKMRELTNARRTWIKREYNKHRENLSTVEDFRKFFIYLRDDCPFIKDSVASGKTWFSFDWLFKWENNFTKAMEGNYERR